MFIQMAHYHKNVIEFDIELFRDGTERYANIRREYRMNERKKTELNGQCASLSSRCERAKKEHNQWQGVIHLFGGQLERAGERESRT